MAACQLTAPLGPLKLSLQNIQVKESDKARRTQHYRGSLAGRGRANLRHRECCCTVLHWKYQHLRGADASQLAAPAFPGRVGSKNGRRLTRCMSEVERESESKATKGSSQLEQLEQLGFGSKGSGKKGGKSTTVRRPAPERPVVSPSSTEPSQEQVYEQYYVVSLAILFGFIIVMGITLAASGFFPEDLDDLVLKYVYPSFSPTIGVFLLGSSLYGLYKYLGGAKPNV